MDVFNTFLQFVSSKGFFISLEDIILFVLFTSFCMLFGRYKLGLLFTYCFVFYLGYVLNGSYCVNILVNTTWGLFLYGVSGFIMVVFLSSVSFKKTEEQEIFSLISSNLPGHTSPLTLLSQAICR